MLTPQEVQKAIGASIEYLQAGQEAQAESELQKVMQTEPNNRLATNLLKQIHEDPITALGAVSFAYRVPAGESLSRIAQRFLNDPLLFYILARYNNIKVPRTLAAGEMLRVPGKAPPMPVRETPVAATGSANSPSPPSAQPAGSPAPPPAPTPSPATGSVSGMAAATPQDAAPAVDAAPAAESSAAKSARFAKQKSDTVARHMRSARAAFAKQDLQGALIGWDAVLAVEPDNRTALLERQRVLSLQEKLGKVK